MSEATQPVTEGALYSRLPRRIQAIAIDAAVLAGVLFVAVMIGSSLPAEGAARWVVRLGLLVVLCYETLMTAYAGGTLGHRALNLRVVDDRTGGNLPLPRAFLRWAGKSLFGVLSFLSMAVTRRHQAVHDMLSASTVQLRDPSLAEPVHYVYEREEEDEEWSGPGALRRIAVGIAYAAVIFVAYVILTITTLSGDCLLENVCTSGEDTWMNVLALLWIGATGAVLVLAWRGRLFGARAYG